MPDTDIQSKALLQYGSQILVRSQGSVCTTRDALMASEAFKRQLTVYLEHLQKRDSPLLETIPSQDPEFWVRLLTRLSEFRLEETALVIPEAVDFLAPAPRQVLRAFVEGMYDHWRSFNRFMVLLGEPGPGSLDRRPYMTFNNTLEALTDLIRGVYRDICENITGHHPSIYRQVPAGCNVGLIAVPKASPLPQPLREAWNEVPFIRQLWIDPPLILDPPSNTRTGRFDEADRDPLEGFRPEPSEWLIYPAQVGPLVVFAAFHNSQISLGCSFANLFELASDAQIARGPDAFMAFGVPPEHLAQWADNPTVTYEDPKTGLLTGVVPAGDKYAYFGYLKKMSLTLHNLAMLRKGRLPFHGALVHIVLAGSREARVLIIGDTATGKSESIEAFRGLAGNKVRDLRIVADDMGSLELTPDGQIRGYGTEIGAFVRLDDLHRGYAFGQMDRAIFMSPYKVNARVVIPVTTLEEVLTPHPVDFILYANNYEEGPELERFETPEAALAVFRAGHAMSKGTTSSTGLTESYYANPFGAPLRKDVHDALAERVFHAAFANGVFVGQIRTRLAKPGFESKGPAAVAEALLAHLS